MSWPDITGDIVLSLPLQVAPQRTEFMTNHNYWIFMDLSPLTASIVAIQDSTIDAILPHLIVVSTAEHTSPISGTIAFTLGSLTSNPNSTQAVFITGNINATYQYVTADINIEDYKINQVLPHLSAQMYGGGYVLVTLPNLTCLINGRVGILGSINEVTPHLQDSLNGKVVILGNIDVSLPCLAPVLNGYTGVKADITTTLPKLIPSITPYMSITGTIIVTLPSDEVYLIIQNTGSPTQICHALSYVDEF